MQTAFAKEPLSGPVLNPRQQALSVAISASITGVRHKLEKLVRSAGAQVVAESAKHDVLLLVIDSHDVLPDSADWSLIATRAASICVIYDDDAPPVVPVSRLLQAGVSGILPFEIDSRHFGAALEAIKDGLRVIHPALLQRSKRPSIRPDLSEELTGREQQVLTMMADGLVNKEIAARLGISMHTVKFHISSILGKLGASSRTEAVSIGMRTGRVLI